MISSIKTSTLTVLILTIFVATSCTTIIVTTPKKDNGNHYGWYKNPNNPHHPMHNKSTGNSKTNNNGKGNNGKGNGKGNKK